MSRGFKGTRVEQKRIGEEQEAGREGAIRSVGRKEGNLSRVDCNGGGRLRDLRVSNIGRENSKGWKEKGQAEKEPVLESTRIVGNRREIVGGLGARGRERVGERRVGRARQWGGSRWGKKADLDPLQRETVERRTDPEHVVLYMKIYKFYTNFAECYLSYCFLRVPIALNLRM